jgi:pyridoxal phosphate enzyme (YggS family)
MNIHHYLSIKRECEEHNAQLIAVTKLRDISLIKELYNSGARAMAENRVQDLLLRKENLPADIEWHMIGKLQKNKVRSIAPFISMIQSVDSRSLMAEINSRGKAANRLIPILLEIKISEEPSKQGYLFQHLLSELTVQPIHEFSHLQFLGVMGMASFTKQSSQIQKEFKQLTEYFHLLKKDYFAKPAFKEISMGMSSDYKIALAEGSTMVRIGSKLFE